MKYVSIDIETTGINSEKCQILQISAVFEDTENVLPIDDLPFFNVFIKHENLSFEPYALEMHRKSGLLETYNTAKKEPINWVCGMLSEWLYDVYDLPRHQHQPFKINVAGKNFTGFDLKFLRQLPSWYVYIDVHRRVIDPAILFLEWFDDKTLPNLDLCLDRAGLENFVTHYALEDAKDVIRVLRTKYTLGECYKCKSYNLDGNDPDCADPNSGGYYRLCLNCNNTQ